MERTSGLRALGVIVGGLLAFAGCSSSGGDAADEPDDDRSTTTVDGSKSPDTTAEEEDRSGPTTELVTVRDPVNDAFSIGVPEGWDNLLYSTVEGQVHHEVVNSISPDGGTVLYIGDPKIPQYWNPDTANPVTVQFDEWLDFMELRRYVPAPEYAPEYAEAKFAELPGFEITDIEPNVETENSLVQIFLDAGLPAPTVHAVTLSFSYEDPDGEPMRGVVILTTLDSGPFWAVNVVGLSTDRSPEDYLPMLSAMTKSQETNPDFIAAQQQRHNQTMAQIDAWRQQMNQQHAANMAYIQRSAAAHQSKMEALWAANDASVASYMDRMAASDVSHREFLNYVNDEHTVASSSGQKFQVDDGYDRYWMNTADGTYVGGDINFDDADLRAAGLNPSSYEEVQIIRG